MQKSILTTVLLSIAIALALEPLAVWDFNAGRNVDAETGMAEFARQQLPVFPGLKSRGTQSIQLLANQKTDTARIFAPSLRQMALRTGVDLATGARFSASGRLAQPLSRLQGSVALWLRPEDWDGQQQGNFRIFFAADDGGSPRTNELLIYKNGSNNNLLFLIGDNDPKKWCSVARSVWGWKRAEWHFVCVAWTPDTLVLYVDGEAQEVPRPRLPAHDYQVVRLGGRDWKNEGGLTLLDDMAVFPRALKREEMEAYYVQTRPIVNDRPAPITHRLGIATPKLDGQIAPFEYGMLTNATFDIHSGEVSCANRWAAARDEQWLYFACDTIKPAREATISRHDGNLWEDESIELHLEHGKHHWQFILNANQAVYDAQNDSPAWNARGLRQAQSQTAERWLVELALPFSDLGIAPEEGGQVYFTLCRSTGGSTGHTAASPLLRKFADRENFIKLVFDRNAFPAEFSYQTLPGSEGRLDMSARIPAGRQAEFRLMATDPKGRKLYEHAVAAVPTDTCAKAEIHATGLSQEGVLSYVLTAGKLDLASAKLKYLSPEKIKVQYLLVHADTQVLETMLAMTPPLPPDLGIVQQLKNKDGQTVLRQATQLGQENAGKYHLPFNWNLADLPPGDYDYYLASLENGKEKVLHHQLFQKPSAKMPWDNFQGGVESTPPMPWHTPRHDGAVLECLTQRYDFGGRLLPVQIFAQGTPLLESPVSLRLNGKVLELPAVMEITQETPLETRFRTKVDNVHGLRLELNGRIEYDGWLWLSLNYASADTANPVQITDLALLLAMSRTTSELVTTFRPSDSELRSGRLDTPRQRDLMDHPVFWLGNADIGLFWGAESLRGTHLAHTENTLSIVPATERSGAVATVKLVDAKFALNTPRTIEFGLQATPVKPLHRIPQPYMFRGGYNFTLTNFHHIFNYYNPAYMDRKVAASQVAAANRDKRPIYAFYSCIYGASPFCPEWPWHCEEWGSTPPGPGQFKQDWPTNDEKARNRGLWTFGCVNHPQFLNWQLYYLNDLIQDRQVGLRDMYFDMAYPRACDNTHHGCGWRDDFGHARKTYPINANRSFTKRIRKILRDKNPQSVLMYHPSGEPLPPLYGLVDFTVDGEIYVAEVARSENYYDIFTPDLMQSCYTGAKSGTNASYISQLNRAAMLFNPARSEYWRRKVKAPEALRAVRHFLGYCLLHDIHPHAGACIYNEGEILEKQLYSLGYDKGDFTFHPYWRKDGPVTCKERVLLSAYSFPGGKTLAVVLNDSKEQSCQATLALVGSAAKVFDLEDGKPVSFPIDIPPKGMRLIVFEAADNP